MLSGPSKAQTLASDPRGQALEPHKWLVHVGFDIMQKLLPPPAPSLQKPLDIFIETGLPA